MRPRFFVRKNENHKWSDRLSEQDEIGYAESAFAYTGA